MLPEGVAQLADDVRQLVAAQESRRRARARQPGTATPAV